MSRMKQQLIQEKIKKSAPEEIAPSANNYAASFCPPVAKSSSGKEQQSQTPALTPMPTPTKILPKKLKVTAMSWPTAGSSVRVRLDATTEIHGVVTSDGMIADALRATGFIGVQTYDGELVEVPYPNKNVIVEHRNSVLDSPSSSSSTVINKSNLKGVKFDIGNDGDDDVAEDRSQASRVDVGVEGSISRGSGGGDMISLSSWPTDQNSDEWKSRSRTLIGKRLSKNTERPMRHPADSDVDDDDPPEVLENEYDDDDDDDVQWVGGHETLPNKKKRKNRAGNEEDNSGDDDSDEEEVHWQTPNDSADIDIEVSDTVK